MKVIKPCGCCGASVLRKPSAIRSSVIFCSVRCRSRVVKRSPGKGYVDKAGYKRLSVNGEFIFEHRFVVEKFLRRKLRASEVVHHLNGDKLDNRIDNLQVMSNSDHCKEHHPITWDVALAASLLKKGVNANKLAKRFGVSRRSIKSAMKVRGISVPRYPLSSNSLGWDLDRAIKLYKSGHSIYRVAKTLGEFRSTVASGLRRRGICS